MGEPLTDVVFGIIQDHPQGLIFNDIRLAVNSIRAYTGFRKVDHALQTLRKSGRIESRKRRWYATRATVEPSEDE